jgi:hypothetical protein
MSQPQAAEWLKQHQQQQQGAAAAAAAGGSSSSSQQPGASASLSPASPAAAAGGEGYHFVCECFFMTLKALHLGVIKVGVLLLLLCGMVACAELQGPDTQGSWGLVRRASLLAALSCAPPLLLPGVRLLLLPPPPLRC